MSLIGDIVGIISGFGKKRAISNATDALVGGYNQGIGTIGTENNRVQGLLDNYTTAGDNAVDAQSALLGLGGDAGAQRRAIDQLRSSPYYQSIYRNGVDTVLGNASATGGLRGGNVQDSLARWGGDALAQAFQQMLSNYGGIASQGLNAINSSGQFGASAADNIASLQTAIGRAKAGGILGNAQANQDLYSSFGNTFNDAVNSIFSALGGGFGGGGGQLGSDFGNLATANNAFAGGFGGGTANTFLPDSAAFPYLPDLPY